MPSDSDSVVVPTVQNDLQSNSRNEWVDDAERIAFGPPDTDVEVDEVDEEASLNADVEVRKRVEEEAASSK